MVTACIVLLYISYAIPVTCLLLKGRNNIPHGPFWMGPIGLIANIVLLCWTVFTLVMYSFPVVMPATGSSSKCMRRAFPIARSIQLKRGPAVNYVSAIYFIVTLILLSYWFIRGKRTFRRRDERHGAANANFEQPSIVR